MHESEHSFEDRIEHLLREFYGTESVIRQHRYQTDRVVDFLVNAGGVDLAIELENDAGSVVGGVGQAILYKNHAPRGRCMPMVVVPDDHAPEEPERTYLEADVPILEESELRERLETASLAR